VDKEGKKLPLQQIREKGYSEKYVGSQNQIYLVGIIFNKNNRNISSFEWEKV